MRLAVIRGGDSPEREVSLRTGAAVAEGLRELGHEVTEFDIDVLTTGALQQALPDTVFNALHGGKGENGAVQGALEIMGIPYTGSGVTASALAMDKIASKRIFESAGLETPDWCALRKGERVAAADFCRRCGWPVVVKPSGLGSTIGISIAKDTASLEAALDQAFDLDEAVLLEQFVEGREVTVAVLDGDPPRALPVVEVVPREGFYDYQAKYTKGATEYIVPAELPEETVAALEFAAIKTFDIIGCRDIARADFIISGNHLWLLEINTLPGMTETSLVPKAAAAAGITFNGLLEEIINSAMRRGKG
ncbi:MAG: D-alanine--D-alanine ligase [bacterium]|nr:D-alanine--D-alanine ligase [bacterium]